MSSPRIHWHPQFEQLKPWVDVATKGLSEDSRARVLEEVSAHFEDAIEDGVKRGLTEEHAAREAVLNLGSAKRARRAFRRTYLTRREAKMLHHLVDTPSANALLFGLGALFAAAVVFLDPPRDAADQSIHVALVGIIAVTAVVRVAAVPALFHIGRRRAAVALAGTAQFMFWSSVSVSGSVPIERRLWIIPIYLLITAVFYVPLTTKIGQLHPQATSRPEKGSL